MIANERLKIVDMKAYLDGKIECWILDSKGGISVITNGKQIIPVFSFRLYPTMIFS